MANDRKILIGFDSDGVQLPAGFELVPLNQIQKNKLRANGVPLSSDEEEGDDDEEL